jgi:hypothetical protein
MNYLKCILLKKLFFIQNNNNQYVLINKNLRFGFKQFIKIIQNIQVYKLSSFQTPYPII